MIPRGHPAVVIPATLAVATFAALTAERRGGDLGAFVVAWIALYPIPRLNPRIPWWLHWVEGAFILLGSWLVTRPH